MVAVVITLVTNLTQLTAIVEDVFVDSGSMVLILEREMLKLKTFMAVIKEGMRLAAQLITLEREMPILTISKDKILEDMDISATFKILENDLLQKTSITKNILE